MNKICTSIEQSKKLTELGIDVNTADMCYRIVAYNPNDTHVYQPYCFVGTLESDIPAWSLSALLELIPPYLGEFKDGIDFGFSKAINGKWYSAYYIKLDDNGLASFNKTVTGDTAIDAVFELICWLLKNKKI